MHINGQLSQKTSNKCLHGKRMLRGLGAPMFFLLHFHKNFVRDNGLMGFGIQVPSHETIVYNLRNAGTDRFLKQYLASVFFIGKQFIDCFPVPLGSACRRWDTLLLWAGNDFPEAGACQIPLKYSAYNWGHIRMYHQLAI